MKNLLKKILACCMVVCMVLTLCVGAVTASAADFDGTFTIVAGKITTADTEAVVKYTAQAGCGIAAAEINVAVPANLSITKLELVADDTAVEVTYAKAEDPQGAAAVLMTTNNASISTVAPYVNDGVFTYIIHMPAGKTIAVPVTVKVTYAGTFEVGSIPLTADVESCKDATSDLLNLEEKGANLVIEEAGCKHTETEEIPAVPATCTEPGATAGVKCSVCGTVITAPTTVEALGHNYVDGICGTCGGADPDYKPECAHTATLENRTVEFGADAIVYNTICAACGEVVSSATDSSENANTVADIITPFKAYAGVEDLNGGTVTMKLSLPEGKTANDIKLAYVDGDKVIANGLHDNTIAYNPITFTSYEDGILTVEVNDEISGIIVAYVLENSAAIDDVLKKAATTYSLEIKSDVAVRFKLARAAKYLQYNGKEIFDSYYTVVIHDAYNLNTPVTRKTEVEMAEDLTDASYYTFPYNIAAKEQSDMLHCYFYGVLDGVSYLLRARDNQAVVEFALSKNCFGNTSTADSVKALKALVADMLRYGTQAQMFFGYNTNNYMTMLESTKDYFEEGNPKYIPGSTASVDEMTNYAEKNTSDYVPGTSTKLVLFTNTLECASKVQLKFKPALKNFIDANYDINKLTFKMYYYDATNVLQPVDLTLEDFTYEGGKWQYYSYTCELIVAKQMDTHAYLEVYYDGGETPIAVNNYSINSLLIKNWNSTDKDKNSVADASLGAICKSIANYGKSANIYFTKYAS